MSFFVSKLIISVDFNDDLNVFNEEMNDEMSSDAFSASKLLLNSS